MGNLVIILKDGIKVGENILTEAELRASTAGDIIDAQEESEKLVQTTDGPRLVSSPTLSGAGMLRRQIVRIGNLQGPIAIDELRRLSPRDMEALQDASARLDGAAMAEVLSERGRGDSSGQADPSAGAGSGK